MLRNYALIFVLQMLGQRLEPVALEKLPSESFLRRKKSENLIRESVAWVSISAWTVRIVGFAPEHSSAE